MKEEKPAQKIIKVASTLMQDEGVNKFLFGTYSDGTPRSLIDCVNNEILSPKQKEKKIYKKKKKKKGKKEIRWFDEK